MNLFAALSRSTLGRLVQPGMLLSTCLACGPWLSRAPREPSRDKFEQFLREVPTTQQRVANTHSFPIWQEHDLAILAQAPSLSTLKKHLGGRHLALLQADRQHAEEARQLAGQGLWRMWQHPDGSANLMIEIPDASTLENLAVLAHSQKGGLPCGNIQVLALEDDITAQDPASPVYLEAAHLPGVATAIQRLDQKKIFDTMDFLGAQGTRYHRSSLGIGVAAKLKERWAPYLTHQAGAKLEFVDHEGTNLTKQPSLIASFPGESTEDGETTIVIGAHLDSINALYSNRDPDGSVAPGVDDDASGIAVLEEVLRVIHDQGWTFARRVEFHAYAAEEIGLVGSRDIADRYRKEGRKVGAMLQLDMTAWSQKTDAGTIYLVENNTNPILRRSLQMLMQNYLDGDYQVKRLGRGTSDHAAWNAQGFPTVFPFEDPENYNPNLHHDTDTTTQATNLKLSERFAALVLSFLAHQAGARPLQSEYQSAKLQMPSADDLFLALVPNSFGSQKVFVSAPQAATRVETCLFSSSSQLGCQHDFLDLSQDHVLNDRAIFASQFGMDLKLQAGNLLTIRAFDGKDRMIAQRFLELTEYTPP